MFLLMVEKVVVDLMVVLEDQEVMVMEQEVVIDVVKDQVQKVDTVEVLAV